MEKGSDSRPLLEAPVRQEGLWIPRLACGEGRREQDQKRQRGPQGLLPDSIDRASLDLLVLDIFNRHTRFASDPFDNRVGVAG